MIEWNKWVANMLPPRLRGYRIIALIKVLLSPMRALYDNFIAWKAKVFIKASATPQVCMLKRIVYDELNVSVDISEGDGKPVDFIIRTSFTDLDKERQLFALLDRYKLAGKSYAYNNTEITYECAWRRFICECKPINNIVITYYWTSDNEGRFIYQLTIQADAPVASDMNIETQVHYPVLDEGDNIAVTIPLLKGKAYADMETWRFDGHFSEVLHPQFDDTYNYNLIIKDIDG